MNLLLGATIFEYIVLFVNLTFLIKEAIKNRNKKKHPFLVYKKPAQSHAAKANEAPHFNNGKNAAILGASLSSGKQKKMRKKRKRRIKKVGSKLNANPSTAVLPSSPNFAEDAHVQPVAQGLNEQTPIKPKRVKKKRKRKRKAKTVAQQE